MTDSLHRRRLIFSIVEFLTKELSSETTHHSDDAKESLEVASQCLQTAFCLAPEDKHLKVSQDLETIFNAATEKARTHGSYGQGPVDKVKS